MSSSLNTFNNIRTTLPGLVNTQAAPLSKVIHFSPSNIGSAPTQLTAYQLMNGAITAGAGSTTAAAILMPTAANILAAYSGYGNRVAVGDVMRISVLNINTGGTGLAFGTNALTVAITGATGALTVTGGTQGQMHINWLAVSTDGTTGSYQLY